MVFLDQQAAGLSQPVILLVGNGEVAHVAANDIVTRHVFDRVFYIGDGDVDDFASVVCEKVDARDAEVLTQALQLCAGGHAYVIGSIEAADAHVSGSPLLLNPDDEDGMLSIVRAVLQDLNIAVAHVSERDLGVRVGPKAYPAGLPAPDYHSVKRAEQVSAEVYGPRGCGRAFSANLDEPSRELTADPVRALQSEDFKIAPGAEPAWIYLRRGNWNDGLSGSPWISAQLIQAAFAAGYQGLFVNEGRAVLDHTAIALLASEPIQGHFFIYGL